METTASRADEVRKVIATTLGVDIDEVKPEVAMRDLGADSLDSVTIVVDLEDAFGIVIPDDDLDSIETVGDAIRIVERSMP